MLNGNWVSSMRQNICHEIKRCLFIISYKVKGSSYKLFQTKNVNILLTIMLVNLQKCFIMNSSFVYNSDSST